MTERRYRFDQLDQTGVLLGLGWLQLAVLGGCLAVVGLAVTAGVPGPVAMVPLGLGCAVAFARAGGRPVTEWLPVIMSWVVAGHRGRVWFAPIDYQRSSSSTGGVRLPSVGDGLKLVQTESRWHRVGRVAIIHDTVEETMTILVPVRGRDFALLDQTSQAEALGRWGETLAAFAGERGMAVRLSWSEYAAPAGLGDHLRWLETQTGKDLNPVSGASPSAAYRSLLGGAESMTSDHQVVVSVTVARSRLRSSHRHNPTSSSGDDPLIDAVLGSTETLLRGLRNAGVDPEPPMTLTQIADLIGWRVDPDRMRRRDQSGRVTRSVPDGPLAVRSEWSLARVDGSYNRSYWIAEWPRLPVPTDWLEPLLTFSGAARRAITVIYEPVAPSASKRRIDSESIKLESDAAAREEKGRRVTAQHRRNQMAVTEREHELVEGFVEFNYAGLVTVSAGDEDELWEGCAHLEQLFREHGLELRALEGRHDLAWAATLGFGLGLGRTVSR